MIRGFLSLVLHQQKELTRWKFEVGSAAAWQQGHHEEIHITCCGVVEQDTGVCQSFSVSGMKQSRGKMKLERKAGSNLRSLRFNLRNKF